MRKNKIKDVRKVVKEELQAARDEINSLFRLGFEHLGENEFEEVAWKLDSCASNILAVIGDQTIPDKINALTRYLDNGKLQKKNTKTKKTKR